jgi:serine/threonine-protein kinase
MNEPPDPLLTVDHSSALADSLVAGLAAGFGPPRSSLGDLRPVLLREAEGDTTPVVQLHSDTMPSPEQTGERYQLQGEIARGGMGAVLRGRDMDLGRDLAIKVLLEKHANRPEVARRFIEEAQIGGQLQHPGVVPVYDIGRFGERPFFTMKLVKGHTLAHLLAKRPDPTEERPRLLSIALQVSQAMAYAHAKGVIHRDLKPANIMVGAFGEVQVMDWGLAKVLAEGGIADEQKASRGRPEDASLIRTARSTGSAGTFGTQTEAGSLLGTPAYMPPEQANGEVASLDRRADVFGLGAILCEILTAKPPYVGRSSEEVRRKAANGDLADAIARLDGCGADTELIVLSKKCLAPEAIDRPTDAQAVADGLTAYVVGVQERLHKAELAEAEARAKAVEEAKRRRLTLALAGTVLAALTLGGGGWLYLKNERDARRAQVTRDINDAVNKATALREQANATPTHSAALFAQAREQVQRALALVDNPGAAANDTLKSQVRQLQTKLNDEEKDRKLIADLDEALLKQAGTLSTRGFTPARAVPLFREAFRAYGMAAGDGDPRTVALRIQQRPAPVREAILATLDEWSDLTASFDLNEPHLKWLWSVLDAAEPPDAWGRQVREARRKPDKATRDARLEALARTARVEQLPTRALTRLARQLPPPHALDLLRRAQRQYLADFWINHDLARALLGVTPPERTEAVRFMSAAVALRPDSAGAENNLGVALGENGQSDEAIVCFRKAVALDPKYSIAQSNLGGALGKKGQSDEAIVCFRKAIDFDPTLAMAHANLGIALEEKGQVDEAISRFRKAIELDPKFVGAHDELGRALRAKGQLDEAIASHQRAIALDAKYAPAHSNLGSVLKSKGRLDEASACFHKAIELDPKYATGHYNLGNFLTDKGLLDEAIACYRKAIQLNPTYAAAYNNLGTALGEKGQIDAAIAALRKSIACDPKVAGVHFNLGNALKLNGQVDAAVACFRKAVELNPKFAPAQCNLGTLLLEKGQVDEAIACYRKAAEFDPRRAPNHYILGSLLKDKGLLDEAIACFKKAIAFNPYFAEAHCELGGALHKQGRFAEALAALQRGHELGMKQPGWRNPSAQWVREMEWMVAMEGKLPAFQRGEFQPRVTAERLGLAGVCVVKKRWAATARLYADAFAADPKLADDQTTNHRYNAACSAARASAGQGEDAATLDDQERTRLRQQALDWLRADLMLRAKQLESARRNGRAEVGQNLRHWQRDRDLAGLRDKETLAKLPAEERAACAKLWADVAALLKTAEAPMKEDR